MKGLHMIAFILLIVGGLNWLLVAFNYNLVAMLGDPIARIVYILVGISAILEVVTHNKNCRNCVKEGGMPSGM